MFNPVSKSLSISLLILILPLLISFQVRAQAITVAPTRLVFEGRDRSAEVNLFNSSAEETEYRIFFKEMDMTEAGRVQEVDTEEERPFSASRIIRYAPRSVRIPPGQAQVVRVLVRKRPDMADGEYRSHLTFQQVPKKAGESLETLAEGQIGIRLTPIYGISIPIIIRHNTQGVLASMKNLSLEGQDEKGRPLIGVDLIRDGDISLYADLEVELQQGQKSYRVGLIRGVGVYTNITKRHLVMALDLPEGVSLKGMLRVDLFDGSDEKPNKEPLSSISLTLNQAIE